MGLSRREKFVFSYNQGIRTSVQFFESCPGFIRELFHPHDLCPNGGVFDRKGQNIALLDRNLTVYFYAHTAIRQVNGTTREILFLVGKIEGDLSLYPRLTPSVGAMFPAEYKPAIGAGVERFYIGGMGTLPAFRAEYF
jgi:hypothetical protein